MSDPAPPPLPRRFVAVGDSTTEGVGDALADGTLRGWADRFAAALAARHGELLYANLAIRGRRTAQILAEQAEPALALQPDLVAAVVGVNDLTASSLDLGELDRDLDALFATLRRDGATVLSATLPDLTGVVPLPRRALDVLRRRHGELNAILEARAAEHGVLVLPMADLPAASDAKLWRPDRIHPNPLGHALLATVMLQLLDGEPLAVAPATLADYGALPYARPGAAAAAAWVARYLVPRAVRRLRGRSSGDGRTPKRPALVRVTAERFGDDTGRSPQQPGRRAPA